MRARGFAKIDGKDFVEANEGKEFTLSSCISEHQAWLQRRLYETRDRTAEVVFVFPDQEIRCHLHVLLSQSDYFQGLFEFKASTGEIGKEIRQEVKDFPASLFKVMVDFFYLGEARIGSDDLVELLQLCQQYFLVKLKLAVERIFADNLDRTNLTDTMMVAKAFECHYLRQRLQQFGDENGVKLHE